MKRVNRYISLCLLMLIGVSSCEVTDFDHQENPNFLTPEGADPTYLLNEIKNTKTLVRIFSLFNMLC